MTVDLDRYACDARFPGLQTVRLIRRAIESTRLDLKGLRVLTEASVGYRRITPVLAALAGADEVYAVGRDSAAPRARRPRSRRRTSPSSRASARACKLLSTRLQAPLDAVDVVTDLPGVRPVDESIIRNVAETAAVSLMRGAAHWRAADVDVATCRRHGIAVAGLDEEAVGLFRYVPQGVLAGLLDLGVEVAGSTIVVAGEGPAVRLRRAGARPPRRARARGGAGDRRPHRPVRRREGRRRARRRRRRRPARRGGRARALPGGLRRRGPSAPARPRTRRASRRPRRTSPSWGWTPRADLRALGAAGLRCRPAGGPDGVFDLLPQAVVAQHAAGLKVAEVMTRARRRGSSPLAAEQLAADRGARRAAAQGPRGRPALTARAAERRRRGRSASRPGTCVRKPARAPVVESRVTTATGGRRPSPRPAAPTSSGGTTNPFARLRMARRTKASSHGYSLLLKDSVIYGGGRALQKFLVALLLPLYTAFLTQADYGILGMVVTVTTFLDVFVTLGFDVAFSRFYFDDKSEAARRRVITNVFYVSTVYPLILLGTVALLMPRLAPLLLGKEYDAGDWRYFAVALATLFFSNLNDLPFTLFRLEHRPWIFTTYTIGRIFVQVPLSIVFVAVFDWGPMGVLLANLFTAAGMQVGLLPTYIRKVDWRWHWQLMRPMLAFAIPALFTGISFYWLKLSDRYFLLHYQGKAVVGLYTVAYSLSQPLYLTLMAFRMAWPQWHYAKLHEPEKHKKMVSRSSTYFLALNALMLVLMGAFMPLIMHTFLNERFWSIGPTTFVLALSVAVYAVYFVFWVGSNVAKKNRMIPVFFLIASAVNIVLNFLLVPDVRDVRRGVDARGRVRDPRRDRLLLLREVVPDPLRVGPAAQDRAGAGLTLAAAWGVGWALGQDVYMPYDQLVLTTLAQVPTLLVFPLVLFVTRFFTPGEREKLRRVLRRLRGRRRGGRGRPWPARAAAARPSHAARRAGARRDRRARPDEAAQRRRRRGRGRRARDGEGGGRRLHRGPLDDDHHMSAT